jgi:hypothetical protein
LNESPGIPTVYEDASGRNALVLDGGGLLSSFRLGDTSGAVSEPFFRGSVSSGGGFNTAYDAQRRRMYFVNALSPQRPLVLMAFDALDSLHASPAWARDLAESGGNPAVGPDGKVYLTDGPTLLELDPDTGDALRSLGGQAFAAGSTPQISNGYLYDFNDAGQVIYDLSSFSLVRTLPGARPSQNTVFASVGAISDTAYAYQVNGFGPFAQFVVYRAVPEPGGLFVVAAGAAAAAMRRRR